MIKAYSLKKHHRGFSMLEVFVAIAISLILMAGILQVYLNSKTSYNMQTGFSQLQEDGRFIENYIVRVLRLGGYRSPPGQTNNFPDIANVFTTTLPYVSGTHGTGPNGSDTLVVRYQGSGNGTGTPDGTVVDCLNQPVDSGTIATNTFSITANNELQCQAQNANSATPNNTQILLSGVENLQVLYGEDLTGDFSADRYVNASYPFLSWNDVVSIRLSMILRTANPVNPMKQNQTFYMLGTSYTPTVDNYLRNQLTFTIVLRNLIMQPF